MTLRRGPDDLEVLAGGCDLMVLPSTPEALALRALLETTDALKALGAARYRVLLTIVPPRPSRDGDEARAALVAAGLPVFETGVRRAVAFQRASLAGCLVGDVDDPRASACRADYEDVCRAILEGAR